MSRALAVALAVALALAVGVWLVSLWRRDASLVDRFWPLLIAAPAWAAAVRLGAPLDIGERGFWSLALLAAWGMRLGWYITSRNWGHGEDRRYAEIRRRNSPGFAWKSLYLVFGLQAVIATLVGTPVVVGAAGMRPFSWLDAAGFVLGTVGVLLEAVADAQMAAFKADPAHRGQVMDRGAWRYSRHPNYFGEACLWWGLWLMALGGAGVAGAWTVVSPLVMTWLLLRVSGVRLLEQDIADRRPAYRAYIERTSAFVPWWPRRAG